MHKLLFTTTAAWTVERFLAILGAEERFFYYPEAILFYCYQQYKFTTSDLISSSIVTKYYMVYSQHCYSDVRNASPKTVLSPARLRASVGRFRSFYTTGL